MPRAKLKFPSGERLSSRTPTLSVMPMCVCDPDCAPLTINGRNAAPTPTSFAQSVSDDFPILYGCCFSAQSFWKRGSFRSGSNIGSSRSSAGVSGMPGPSAPAYGIESSFCNAAMARSGSPMRAATRARISSGMGPTIASFSIGIHRLSPAPPEPTRQFSHQDPYWSGRDRQ